MTIPTGSATAEIEVAPVDDILGETSETVRVSLSSGQYRIGTASWASLAIVDNDPVVTISVSDAVVSERGLDAGEFTITRSGGDLLVPLTVLLMTQGQATSGEDYAALPLSVEILANLTSTIVPLTPLSDTALEGEETVQVLLKQGAYRLGYPASASIEIIDAYPRVSVSATDVPGSEDGPDTAEVTFTRTDCDLIAPLTVTYTVGGVASPGSDYQSLTGTIEIPAGSASVPLTILPIDDTEGEWSETVVITIDDGPYIITRPTATVTILDDESLVSIATTQYYANEEGPVAATFTVTRTDGNQTEDLVVGYSLSGSAEPGDYVAPPQGSVTILVNESTATIEITPVDDSEVEETETVVVTLGSGEYRLPYSFGGVGFATAIILDNEPVASIPLVYIQATAPFATELDQVSGTFTVTRDGNHTSGDLAVTFSVSGSAIEGTDYQTLTRTVTIPDTQTIATIDVTPIVDSLAEYNEFVFVTLVDEEEYDFYYSFFPPSATVTIRDKPFVSIEATDPDAAEEGTDPGQFIVSRTGSTADELVVYYTVSAATGMGSNAIADSDYTGLPGYLSIPAGSSNATIDVTPIDDILAESPEQVQIVLSYHIQYWADSAAASGTVTIADNEPSVGIEATDASAAEEGLDPGEFTITRSSGDWSQPLTVLYSVAGSADAAVDYSGMSVLGIGSATIEAGNPSATISVVPIDDTVVDPDETIEVVLQYNTTYAISAGTAVVTIIDDEPVVSVEATDSVGAEDGPEQAKFTVTRSGSTTSGLTVYYTVSGTADFEIQPDYTGLPNFDGVGSGWVTIPAGSLSEVITITPIDDDSIERDEMVTLTLSTDAGYPVIAPGLASVTIASDDVLAPATNLTATALSDTQISVTWTDNDERESGYEIERMTDGSAWTQIGSVAEDVSSYIDSGLSEGSLCYYRVRTTHTVMHSPYTGLTFATTLSTGPGDLSVTFINGNRVSLIWQDNSGIESQYYVEQLVSGDWQQIGPPQDPDTATATVSGSFAPSAEYSFRVRAYGQAYYSDDQYSLPSNVVTMTTAAWPAAPSDLTATAVSGTQVDLAWTGNATDQTGCKVEWSSDGTNWSALVTAAADETTYSDSGLTEGTLRFYRVFATNSIGDSGYSGTVSATTLPATPTDLEATIVDGSQVNLTWDDNSSIETGYSVEQWFGSDWQEVEQADTRPALRFRVRAADREPAEIDRPRTGTLFVGRPFVSVLAASGIPVRVQLPQPNPAVIVDRIRGSKHHPNRVQRQQGEAVAEAGFALVSSGNLAMWWRSW